MKIPKFVIDANLGRLTKYLRFAGFDCLSSEHLGEPAILRLCQNNKAYFLTRNKKIPLLLKKINILIINSNNYLKQIEEFKTHFTINNDLIFTRCILCNNLLSYSVTKHIEIPIHITHENLKYCPHCKKLFWNGSHYQNMKQCLLNPLINNQEI